MEGNSFLAREGEASTAVTLPHRPWDFFLLPHYGLCLQLLQNSEDFSFVMTKHCYVIENDTGFANRATKTSMHIVAYVVKVFIKYFSIIVLYEENS